MGDELDEVKAERARLLEEKARADAAWHTEVRDWLKTLSDEVHSIRVNTNDWPQIRRSIDNLSVRVRTMEDFKIRASFIVCFAFVVANGVTFALWKAIDVYLKLSTP